MDDYTYTVTITGSLANARLQIALDERIALCRKERDRAERFGTKEGAAEWEERIDGLLDILRSVKNAKAEWHALA